MKSRIRNFALAASVVAISLSAMPNNAAALTRASGGSKVPYIQIATTASTSPADMLAKVVIMAADNFLWFPTAR